MLKTTYQEKSFSWIAVLVTVTLINGGILWWYHNRTWWGPDDGQLAHVANRILSGEVLHRDIQDVRPGYVNFINAGALYIFGPSLLSLRYPLTIMVLGQSILLFFLFRPHGAILAGSLSLGSVTLGVLHYLNPNHHWYALFFTILLICHLLWSPRKSPWYLPIAGLLITTVGLTRHLTGALVGMGTLSYLLFEETRERPEAIPWRQLWVARLLCGSMLILLSLYLFQSTDAMGFLLFGLWPVSFLAWQLTTLMVSNKRTLRIFGDLSLGMVISALPLFSYHILNNSLAAMIDDNLVRALDVLTWDYAKDRYWWLLVGGLIEFGDNPGVVSLLNGMYFFTLPLFSALNGCLLLLTVGRKISTPSLALPILATFYGLVSLLTQRPVYLYFTVILSIAGSLWLLLTVIPRWKFMMSLWLLFLSGVSIGFHAGEPITRTIIDYLRATKTALINSRNQLPRVGLKIDEPSLKSYRNVVDIIEKETHNGDYIFAIPNNSEIYFMTGRRNPFRFFSTDHGVLSQTEVQSVIKTLETLRPRIITFSPDDTRNTSHSLAIIEHVRANAKLLSKDNFFEVYLYGEPILPPKKL